MFEFITDSNAAVETTDTIGSNYDTLALVWFTALALIGGYVQYLRKVKMGSIIKFSIAELIGELTISGFVGLLAFLFCDANSLHPSITAIFIGMTAYMGSRAIFFFEFWYKKKIGAITHLTEKELEQAIEPTFTQEQVDLIIKKALEATKTDLLSK